MKNILISTFLICMLLSCHSEQRNEKIAASSVDLVADVMTEEKQKQMSMEAILEDLMFGNKRFMESKMILRDHKAQLNQLAAAQHPKAVVLSCIDSRVPVEQIFDQGIGDLFVVRVAGNIDNDHNIASIEYGCKVAGAKLLIVLGHEQCGAIKSAVKGVDMGNITELLTHMRPAIEHHRDFPGDQSVDNHDFLEIITKENAVMTLDDIRRHSEIIRNMEAQGLIKLVAAYYDLDEGKIEIINEEDYHFDD